MGLCHGWAAAAIFVPAPVLKVTTVGPRGSKIDWYPDDIKALATLAWSRGNFRANQISGRCDTKNPKTYPNGRLSEQECFDTNPATFHLALGNLIGRQGFAFIMDAAYDYEVWNQPILSYEFEYFNPLDPKQRARNGIISSCPMMPSSSAMIASKPRSLVESGCQEIEIRRQGNQAGGRRRCDGSVRDRGVGSGHSEPAAE